VVVVCRAVGGEGDGGEGEGRWPCEGKVDDSPIWAGRWGRNPLLAAS